ncbi:MAG: PIG-L deacetylase family protein [Candidatus Omnitrophota bacterium]
MRDIRKVIYPQKKILILAPHPDDDCIGMGATIYFLKKSLATIKILYLTSGWRGVKGNIPRAKKDKLRKVEAHYAVRVLGLAKRDIKFLSLPFYNKRKIGSEDIQILTEEIKRFHPQIIFTCGEEKDPHLTHKKCWEIIKESMKNLGFSPKVYIYRVWKFFKKFDFYFPFTRKLMEMKIEAIKAHRSQLKPRYTKHKIYSFWERESKLNEFYGEILRKNYGMKNFLFAEVFKSCPYNPEKNRYFGKEKRNIYKIVE